MKWITLNTKQFSISKYLLYFIAMGLLLKQLLPKIWYSFSFIKTKGIVDSYTYSEYQGRRGRTTSYYPVVNYVVRSDTFTCYGSSFEHDELHPNDKVSVIYDPGDPANAFVYTFLGFWAPRLTYIIPFSLLLSLAFLGLDSIPTHITIRF